MSVDEKIMSVDDKTSDSEANSADIEVHRVNDNPTGEKSTAEFVEDVGAQVEVFTTAADGSKVKTTLPGVVHQDGRRELRIRDAFDKTGYSWPWWRKWSILAVIFICQVSMNFNAGFYPNGLELVAERFNVSVPKARVSQMLMMVAYAFGCELWAPWSEELGRWPVMQLSLGLVNIWQILGGKAPNYGAICVARFFTGLFSAGGSVTLAIVADMWESVDQGFAVLFVVLSSVGGSAVAPIFGGIYHDNLKWYWNFWIQLIIGGFAQALHLVIVPETRTSILLDREAKRRRKSGEDDNIWGPTEIHGHDFSLKSVTTIWLRPFVFLATEPIVTWLSLLSGFSDALIFIFMESFGPVYSKWGFGNTASGLVFVAVLIGYLIAYAVHFLDTWRQIFVMKRDGEHVYPPERRLKVLLYLVLLEPTGLFCFGWTSWGPSKGIPWIAPTIAATMVAVANFSIYMATIDYMVMSYGIYSASACGCNGFARDFLAGISVMFADPMYSGKYNGSSALSTEWASTILGIVAILVAIPVYIFYWHGPAIRARSKFALSLASDKEFEKLQIEEFYEDHDEKATTQETEVV